MESLREAWEQGRERFRTTFFELIGQNPAFFAMAPCLLYRAIGDKLPYRLG